MEAPVLEDRLDGVTSFFFSFFFFWHFQESLVRWYYILTFSVWKSLFKEVYSPGQKVLLQKINRTINLANCFFQMFAVIFMQDPAGIVTLVFLPRTS